MNNDLIRFGSVTGVKGIRGECKALITTDVPEHYLSLSCCWMQKPDGGLSEYRITKIRINPASVNQFLIHFGGIADRTAAEALIGYDMLVEEALAAPKSDTEMYVHDLIGCRLIDKDNVDFGLVTGYFENGAQGILEVDYNGKQFLVPMTDEIITEYRIAQKELLFNPIEGLIDLNEKKS